MHGQGNHTKVTESQAGTTLTWEGSTKERREEQGFREVLPGAGQRTGENTNHPCLSTRRRPQHLPETARQPPGRWGGPSSLMTTLRLREGLLRLLSPRPMRNHPHSNAHIITTPANTCGGLPGLHAPPHTRHLSLLLLLVGQSCSQALRWAE